MKMIIMILKAKKSQKTIKYNLLVELLLQTKITILKLIKKNK